MVQNYLTLNNVYDWQNQRGNVSPDASIYVRTAPSNLAALGKEKSGKDTSSMGGDFYNKFTVADLDNFFSNPANFPQQTGIADLDAQFSFTNPSPMQQGTGGGGRNADGTAFNRDAAIMGQYTAPIYNALTDPYYGTRHGSYQLRSDAQDNPRALGEYFLPFGGEGAPTQANLSSQDRLGLLSNASNLGIDQASGFGSKFLKPLVKAAVPLAIGSVATLGLGSALGAGLAGGAGTGLSKGALGLASQGSLFAPGSFAAGTATGGLASSLGNFSTKSALSGAIKGGVSGLASGDGLSGALKGAALGGATGGFGSSIASGLGISSQAGQQALTGALTGASGGVATGNLQNAALGGALGGLGGYVKAGGNIPGLGRVGETINWNQGGTTNLSEGTGLLGLAQSAKTGLSGLTEGRTSMLGNALKIGGAFYEDSANRKNNEKIAQALAEAQGRAQGQLSPYVQAGADATGRLSSALAAGFNPGDLTQDPGYQFRLQQGEEALARRMAASGLGQSGAALKAAQEYGQGLADQTYNDAYQRWLAKNQQEGGLSEQGLSAAGSAAGLESDLGSIQAQLMAANQQSKNNRLASILGGIGAFF